MFETSATKLLDNKAILMEAWQKTKGYKRVYWSALGMIVLTFLIISLVFMPLHYLVNEYVTTTPPSLLDFVNNMNLVMKSWPDFLITFIAGLFENLSRYFFLLPLMAGLWVITIKRSLLEAVDSKMIFHYFSLAKTLLVGKILITLRIFMVILIGMAIPKLFMNSFGLGSKGLYLLFALSMLLSISYIFYVIFNYMWFIPIVASRQCSAREALRLSSNLFWHNKAKVLAITTIATLPFLVIFMLCIPFVALGNFGILISVIFMIVAGIWIFPWYQLVNGILYREVTQFNSQQAV